MPGAFFSTDANFAATLCVLRCGSQAPLTTSAAFASFSQAIWRSMVLWLACSDLRATPRMVARGVRAFEPFATSSVRASF